MLILLRLSIVAFWIIETLSATTIPEYLLEAGGAGHCGQNVNVNSSAYVKSHAAAGLLGGLSSYIASQNCEITMNAATGYQLLLQFTFFDLQPPVSSVCVDSVQLTGVTTTSTQSPTTTEASTSTTTTTTTTLPTTTLNATIENSTLANTTETENATASNVTSGDDSSTLSTHSMSSSTPDYVEPAGVNATFWNTTEVCNFTQTNETINGTNVETNETLCWNVTESYVVWIPYSSTSPTSSPSGAVQICESPGTYVSTGTTVSVKFVSDASIQRAGFILLLTQFHTGQCTEAEFQCDTSRCISRDLLCDGVTHCVSGEDESTVEANCTSSSSVTSSGGMNTYAIIGIVVVVAGVVLTLITSIMFWKFFSDSKGSCKCRGEDEEEDPGQWASPPKVEPVKPIKPKKTVTIESEKKVTPPTKAPIKKKVQPVVSDNVEW